jgi:hypothetical protein
VTGHACGTVTARSPHVRRHGGALGGCWPAARWDRGGPVGPQGGAGQSFAGGFSLRKKDSDEAVEGAAWRWRQVVS